MFSRVVLAVIIGFTSISSSSLSCAFSNETTIDILSGAAQYDDNLENDFSPNPSMVGSRTKITWINKDFRVPHLIKADNDLFKSPMLVFDQEYSLVLDKKGIYPYHCEVHPWMKGLIEVR